MQGLEQQVNSCQAADAGAPFPSRGASSTSEEVRKMGKIHMWDTHT